MKRRATVLAALAAAAGVTACGDDDGGTADGRVRVVASTTHLADLARQVGGDRVAVTGLLQPGSDPHDYEPRPDDLRAVSEAGVLLVSGLELDDWTGEVAENAGKQDAVVDVGAAVPVQRDGEGHDHGGEEEGHEEHGETDPHWWQDPRNVAAAAVRIRDAIAEADPDAKAAVTANAARFTRRLEALDREVRACVARVPAGERKLVTDHDAFGYLAAHLGLDVVGAVVPSLTSQAQPSAGDLAALARTIERERVKAVFPEAQLEPRLARAIARRTGVASDFRLLSDALAPRGEDGDTVLGAYAHNARELVRGMSGGAVTCDVQA